MNDRQRFAAAAARAREGTSDVHTHSKSCTDSSCPGNGFVTREQLVARSLARNVRPAAPDSRLN